MHNGHWNDGWGGGSLWLMSIMMIAFMVALGWVIVTLVRNNNRAQPHQLATQGATASNRSTPQEILAERLARGEIEPDEYSKRLAALLGTPTS